VCQYWNKATYDEDENYYSEIYNLHLHITTSCVFSYDLRLTIPTATMAAIYQLSSDFSASKCVLTVLQKYARVYLKLRTVLIQTRAAKSQN